MGTWAYLLVLPCRLVQLMQNIECKINLIVFNPHKGTRFTPTGMDQVMAFRSVLIQVACWNQAGHTWQCPVSQKAGKGSYEARVSYSMIMSSVWHCLTSHPFSAQAATCTTPEQGCGLHIQQSHMVSCSERLQGSISQCEVAMTACCAAF